MKVVVILVVIAFAALMTLWANYISNQLSGYESGIGWDDRPEPVELSKFRKGWKIIFVSGIVVFVVALGFLVDNWQTIVTLLLLAEILPIIARDLKTGLCYLPIMVIALVIIWQLPSTTAREEKVVDEVVKIATPSGAEGSVDVAVVEDRGQYLFLKESEDSSIAQESIPADLVNGHYIDNDRNSVVVYHYIDTYRRTFWSKERTKFVGRKLWNADLYIKRDQLLNTF